MVSFDKPPFCRQGPISLAALGLLHLSKPASSLQITDWQDAALSGVSRRQGEKYNPMAIKAAADTAMITS